MEMAEKTLNASPRPGNFSGGNRTHYSDQLLEHARSDIDAVLKALGSGLSGLSETEADSRLKQVGTNEIAREKHQSAAMRLLANLKNPLVLLLLGSNVESGSATAVVLHTGDRTYFGSLAASIVGQRQLTTFDRRREQVHLADDLLHRRNGSGGLPDQRTEPAQLAGSCP
jgi:magnesium-transporting ATPase (P-type)